LPYLPLQAILEWRDISFPFPFLFLNSQDCVARNLIFLQPLAVEANHAKAIQFIREAASQGSHLAVLPEYHLTNWVPDDPKFIPACADYQKYLDAYCALAKELNSE